jgi:hypothetical protein
MKKVTILGSVAMQKMSSMPGCIGKRINDIFLRQKRRGRTGHDICIDVTACANPPCANDVVRLSFPNIVENDQEVIVAVRTGDTFCSAPKQPDCTRLVLCDKLWEEPLQVRVIREG